MAVIGQGPRAIQEQNAPCKSTCGFQSESNKMTVSAVCKLIPRPVECVKGK
jgi:hypothetical protein